VQKKNVRITIKSQRKTCSGEKTHCIVPSGQSPAVFRARGVAINDQIKEDLLGCGGERRK